MHETAVTSTNYLQRRQLEQEREVALLQHPVQLHREDRAHAGHRRPQRQNLPETSESLDEEERNPDAGASKKYRLLFDPYFAI